MKILNINSYYYSSSVHKELQRNILKQGIDSVTYVPLQKGYIPREECQYGEETHVYKSECYKSIDRYIFHIKQKKVLYDLIKQNFNIKEFQCLHAHSLFSNGYIALKIKKRFNIPYIVSVRDTDVNIFFRYMVHLRGIGVTILEEAEKVVFLSEPYRKYLIKNYIPVKLEQEILNKSVVVPNGIDEFWLNNKAVAKENNFNKGLKLLHVGAINKRKNIIITVKAVEHLRNRGFNIVLTVVGKIEDKFIYNQIKDIPYVKYIKPVPKEELIKIYRDNDIFVMPSITETFGLVYAEAISQGLPVIYTKEQGFDGHFMDGQVGYSVKHFDYKEVADRILRITKSYNEISSRCINLSDKFDWTNIIEQYKKIYI